MSCPREDGVVLCSSPETTDRVCVHDALLLVGDFNTRVGSSERQEDVSRWEAVRDKKMFQGGKE